MCGSKNESIAFRVFSKCKGLRLDSDCHQAPSLMINLVTAAMAALVAFNYINMGVQLDLHCIGKVLKETHRTSHWIRLPIFFCSCPW
ncbi:hypothetical protein CEXT_193421 [Caerostris extrusa]|uniref:Uncharacterized protein n=1 Tax=Caerostris extrusa TaxID=172846 RepID=A0AAV4QYM6_CAEEX|nr:hypothetical protein CEXT_193421 [Caerostris extrusa]